MGRPAISYSEAFKRRLVSELEQGKFASIYAVRKAYGIMGNMTVSRWVRQYGHKNLLPIKVRVETLKERDELREARKRIRELEAALADSHIDYCLEESYLRIACECMDCDPSDFKKKNAITLSDIRKKRRALK